MHHDIQLALKEGKKAEAICMDLTSPFDTVRHDGLIYKLYSMDLPTITIRWIIQFLTNKTTKIKAVGELSENITIQRGVPQGVALSPILYSIYVNHTPISSTNQIQRGLHKQISR